MIATDAPGTDAPAGPSTEEDAAFLAQERESGILPGSPLPAESPEEKGELPPMEDLVKRIPAPARELMEELFRAKFVTVKRLPRSALK